MYKNMHQVKGEEMTEEEMMMDGQRTEADSKLFKEEMEQALYKQEVLEAEFIEETGYLFDISQCEGLLGPNNKWLPIDDIEGGLEEILHLIREEHYVALPF